MSKQIKHYQDATLWYLGELLDASNNPINGTQISAMNITLYDEDTNTFINGRDESNVFDSANWGVGATVDTARSPYNLHIILSTADNTMVTSGRRPGDTERHWLIVKGITSGSGHGFTHVAPLDITVTGTPVAP